MWLPSPEPSGGACTVNEPPDASVQVEAPCTLSSVPARLLPPLSAAVSVTVTAILCHDESALSVTVGAVVSMLT